MAGESNSPVFAPEGDIVNYLIPFSGIQDFDNLSEEEQESFYQDLEVNGYSTRTLLKKLQNFSFRPADKKNTTQISIVPSSYSDNEINKDISLKNVKVGNFQDLLNTIPTIQIREYALDSRLVQIMNVFSAFSAGWDAFSKIAENKDKWKTFVSLLFGTSLMDKTSFFTEVFSKVSTFPGGVDDNSMTDDTIKQWVLKLPFTLYYQLMSSKTTGAYILPYSGKVVDSSNGSVGWNTQHGFNGLGTSRNSMLGTIVNFFGHNLKFNTQPTWDGNTNNDYPPMEVTFDLFNDSCEKAVNNFIFLNTIIPKNRFIQYGLFQHNPCVYDVKVQGFGRFYMCSANMNCTYKGVSRIPSKQFLRSLHDNVADTMSNFLTAEKLKDMVRIPDVYSFTLTFTPLLPNSLNNFLYRYVGNPDILADYSDFGKTVAMDEMLPEISKRLSDAARDAEIELPDGVSNILEINQEQPKTQTPKT